MATPTNLNQNIPQATDLMSQSQPQILLNWQAIAAWMDTNHVDFAVSGQNPASSTFNAGKHNFVQMPIIRTTVPNPGYTITGTGSGEVALFCQASVINKSNPPSLWFLPQSTALANGIEISQYQTGTYTGAGQQSQTYCVFFLPNGLIVKLGNVAAVGSNLSMPQSLTYPTGTGIPAFTTAVYYVSANWTNPAGSNVENDALVVQPFGNSSDLTTVRVTSNNDTWSSGNGLYYIAVGI